MNKIKQRQLLIPFSFIAATFESLELFAGKGFIIKNLKSKIKNGITSLGIMAVCLGLSYAPVLGFERTIIVVSGTELQEPLQALAAKFEQQNPSMHLELKIQGSQDIVNNFIDQKNDFKPTILIPVNGKILTGFRLVNSSVDLTTVPNSPWSKNIPGVQAKPRQQIIPPPDNSILTDI